jgi:Flp pilus assembly protein TadG
MSTWLRLRRSECGSAAVEFALLAPVLITMMVGILQVGVMVQNYSAVRSVGADVARHAMIAFTVGQPMTETAMSDYGESIAEAPPYFMSDARLTVTVAPVATPQVASTIEKTLTITYHAPSFIESLGLRGPTISYSRPIIVTDS